MKFASPGISSSLESRHVPSTAPTVRFSSPSFILALLAVGAFFSGVSMRIADPLLPFFTRSFDIGLSEAGQSVTLFTVAYATSLCVMGTLGDRFGKLRLVGISCLLCALTNLLCALAPDFDWFRAGRFLTGAFCSGVMTLAMAWLGDTMAYETRHASLSRLLVGMSLGVSGGILLGGLAADQVLDWRLVFGGLAVGFLFVGLGVLQMHHKAKTPPGMASIVPAGVAPLTDLRALLSMPAMRFMLALVSVEGALYFGALVFIPSHLNAVHDVTMSIAGMVGMFVGIGGVFFSLLAPLFLRLGERRMLATGGLLLGSSILVAGLAPVSAAFPACFLAGAGFYMFHSTLQVQTTQLAPERRGASMAFFSAFFFAGQALGVSGAGWLVQKYGSRFTLALFGCGLLVMTLVLLQRRRH